MRRCERNDGYAQSSDGRRLQYRTPAGAGKRRRRVRNDAGIPYRSRSTAANFDVHLNLVDAT